jgi:hypothetical protein
MRLEAKAMNEGIATPDFRSLPSALIRVDPRIIASTQP